MAVAVIKVCGITDPTELEFLASVGVDWAGLWWGIPGGRSELSRARLAELAQRGGAGLGPEPVLVTFCDRAVELAAVLAYSGIRWVQLHAYQPPAFVSELRSLTDRRLQIVKVLHIRSGRCLERRFIERYERAGVAMFLADTATDDGQVGSTGQSLDQRSTLDVIESCRRPVMLAGGLNAANAARFAEVRDHERFGGADFDTHARGSNGALDSTKIAEIVAAWR